MAEYAISRAEEGVTSHNEKPTSTTKTVADTNTPQTLEIVGFVGTADDLPRNYYWSSYFLGTFFAISMSFLSGNGGFAYIAPVLGLVNADLGPSENIIWVAIVYTLSLAAGMLMVGRLTDLFGRRWFFIGGGLLGIVGSIVCARAQNVNTLIGGEVLIGLGASTGVSYPFVVGELVPVKYRFAACGLVYVIMYGNGFGAAISTAFILYTSPGWRWCYYLLVITNSLATASFFAFYHPPTFRMKYERTSRMQIIKNFDYVGTVLFLAGLIMFLLGLNWGGQQYAWKSAQVVCTLVLGLACMVAFGVWEAMARLKEPLLPAHLFNNVPWVASVLLLSLGASVYYAFNVVWASMVQMVYAHPDDPMWAGWVMSLIGLVIGTGEIVGGLLAEKIGKVKYQCMFMITVASVCLASAAVCTPDTQGVAIALVCIVCFTIGWNEAIALTLCTICIRDQQEIGVAAGFAGSLRSVVGGVALTVYEVVLKARLQHTIPARIVPAVVEAGLPATSVARFITALTSGNVTAMSTIKGSSETIVVVGARAYKFANTDAFRTVFLTSIAFGGMAILLTFFVPNVDHLMTMDVTATLHERGKESIVGMSDELERKSVD